MEQTLCPATDGPHDYEWDATDAGGYCACVECKRPAPDEEL